MSYNITVHFCKQKHILTFVKNYLDYYHLQLAKRAGIAHVKFQLQSNISII